MKRLSFNCHAHFGIVKPVISMIRKVLVVVPLVTGLSKTAVSQASVASSISVNKNAPHFHHVHLNSRQPAATLKFYEKFFGATPLAYRGRAQALFTERSFILIDSMPNKPLSNERTTLWHIGWAGVDGHSEFNWRMKAGIQAATTLAGAKLPEREDSVHYMYFKGPEDELVEVSTVNRNHRFEHIHLLSSDINTSTGWFKNNLGLAPAFNKAIAFYGVLMNFIVIDNVTIVFFGKQTGQPKSILVPENAFPRNGYSNTDSCAIGHIGFSFTNIQPVLQHMKASGLQLLTDIGLNGNYGFRSFLVRGPDGLLIEIVEERSVPAGSW